MKLKPKQKQYILFSGIVGICLALFLSVLLSVEETAPPRTKLTEKQETNITTVGQRINPQEIWVEKLESENKLTQHKLNALEKLISSQTKASLEADKKYEKIRQEFEQKKAQVPFQNTSSPRASFLPFPPGQEEPSAPSPASLKKPRGVRKIVLKLAAKRKDTQKKKESKTPENTIPAGSFAKAILLGGVDASTSVGAQNDPRPVLLRITDKGNLPRKFKSDLKACHVLASSYGDLSSERVYMRLEKLTCTERLTGEISETEVAGYVVGEDGRAGIRGVVADRAGPLIRNSFIGGFLSGMSNFFGAQQQKSVFPVSPFGQTNALTGDQLLSSSAAQGTTTAMDKYAEFYIKRAEQLQPVLQVAAGRSVDIVFTQGTAFGETSVKKTLGKIRNKSRAQAVEHLETQADDKNWIPK